ncbi:uncharacterized protein A1O5_09581 [Cladophialophora psammophila CBS 110553]|uniref:ARCA protein n=1 Tax=Cladophialophora psammophila CBS 110553 TaxID=1182543 RepID=W9WI27_9EURO|nr:uncharacterized protein A1O5_09581 [Cladophialophora psammophila CBS 110553]EXJ67568.1 hypothetical protein A1O5_09581 [Cladophialophora psammophila CBS 110553]
MFSSTAYRMDDGVCQYRGVSLPSLTYAKILQHHTICVTNLLDLCNNSAFVEDENLLAALVSLRFHEEMDRYQTGVDKERLLNSLRFVLNAQTKMVQHETGYDPPRHGAIVQPASWALGYLKSFRHSLFRNALRQELTAAYLTQRGVQYPLELWTVLDTLESPDDEDVIWSDRHLLHCARVLNFCYGSGEAGEASGRERWEELKNYETRWQEQMPTSFLPLLQGESSIASGQLLYRVWYLSPLHLTAVQFFELSRILLLVLDPSVPRLGPRAVAARQQMSREVRRIVLHLCSMAASYPELTPAWVQASMAIYICGEFFTVRHEQEVLLSVLHHLEKNHGWPTSQNAARLKEIWNYDVGRQAC